MGAKQMLFNSFGIRWYVLLARAVVHKWEWVDISKDWRVKCPGNLCKGLECLEHNAD